MPTPVTAPTKTHTTESTVSTITTHEHKELSWIEVLPFIMPVLLFLSGYLLNRIVEQYKENKRLEIIRELFYSETSKLEKAIAKQSQGISDKIPNIESLSNSDVMIPIVTSLKTERLSNIPDSDLYKLFVVKKKDIGKAVSSLRAIAGVTDFISDFKPRIILLNDELYTRVSNFNKEWLVNYDKLLNISNLIVIKNRETIQQDNTEAGKFGIDAETGKLLDLITKYKEAIQLAENKDAISTVYTVLVKPLHAESNFVVVNSANYEMLTLIQKLMLDYKALKSYTKALVAQLKSLKKNLDDANTDIGNAVAHFKTQ